MKRIYSELLCAALIGACVSCTPEDEFTRSNGQMGLLGFSVGVADDNDASATRSESYVVDTFVLDGDTLALVCTVTDMDAPVPEAEEVTDTRGVPIYTRPEAAGTSARFNLESVYGYFNLSGYKVVGSTLQPFFYNYAKDGKTYMGTNTATDTYVNIPYKYESYETKSSKRTEWEYWIPADAGDTDPKSGKFFWWRDEVNAENDYKLQFFAYSPTTDVTAYPWNPDNMVNSYGGIITFDYEVPTGGTTGTYKDRDAEKQPDILVGATAALERVDLDEEDFTDGKHYVVPLTFYHALCGVRFKAATELATNEQGLVINAVTLSGLKSEGACTFTLGASGDKSADKISWAFASGSANDGVYTQTFDYTVPTTLDADDATIYGEEEGTNAKMNFMLIPQSFGTASGVDSPDATITITYTYHDVTKTKEIPLFHKNSSSTVTSYAWEAGKLYTYEIQKIAGSVDVEVIESFSSPYQTKSNVNVKNIGLSNAYVRAAVVANWVDDNGVIVAPCEPTFTPGTNWYKSSDGFYYYKNIIKPGNAPANNLIGSYTAPTSPVSGAHLEMHVVGQGIDASTTLSSIYGYWSGASSAGLTTTLEP